jgi:ABC-type branched-subunit amino acid transport system substrate-binding protein
MRHQKPVLAVAATIAILLTTACGGGGGTTSTGSTGPTATATTSGTAAANKLTWSPGSFSVDPSSLKCGGKAPQPTRGVTDTTIKVGGLVDLTSNTTSNFSGAEIGAQAFFARINAEGGVNGRKYEYVKTRDTGTQPSRALDGAKQLTEQDGVFAASPVLSVFGSAADVFCKSGTPFTGWAINTGFCNNALGFGFSGCLIGSKGNPVPDVNQLVGKALRPNSKTLSWALIGDDNDNAKFGVNVLAGGIRAGGGEVVYAKTPLPVNAPLSDPSPYVHALLTANHGKAPDFVYYITSFDNGSRMTAAMKAGGYNGLQVSATNYDPRLANIPALQGAGALVQWAPWQATDVPAVKQMNDDLDTYGTKLNGGRPVLKSLVTAAGYLSAKLLNDLIKATGRNLTVDALVAKANAGLVTGGDGLVPEQRWPVLHAIGYPCDAVVLVNKGYDIAAPLHCGELVAAR